MPQTEKFAVAMDRCSNHYDNTCPHDACSRQADTGWISQPVP